MDIGTGTGIIALMMAQRYPAAQVTAIDIDEGAVVQATANVAASPFSHRIEMMPIRVQDLCAVQSCQGIYDGVVSNPPFFIDSLKPRSACQSKKSQSAFQGKNAPDCQRSIARHADTLTYGELMQSAKHLLSDDGELSVVVPFDYRQRMEDEATFCGFFPSRLCAVHTVAGRMARRYLLAFRKHPCAVECDSITIGDEAYRRLTQDFYL